MASYLDAVTGDEHDNPSDYAIHLSRRARGIPLWLSLLANGTASYREAVDHCLDVAEYAVRRINASTHLEIVGNPTLSVVLFRRVGWSAEQYRAWSTWAASNGFALVTPTELDGETVFRFCIVNPLTTDADIDLIVDRIH